MQSVSLPQYDYAVLIGRFQSPVIHLGYEYLFSVANSLAKKVLIYITSSDRPDSKNPLSFDLRSELIQRFYSKNCPNITVGIHNDILHQCSTNDEWASHVAAVLNKRFSVETHKVVLISGRDGFLNYVNTDIFHRNGYYTYKIPEVPGLNDFSSTAQRAKQFKRLHEISDQELEAYAYACVDQSEKIFSYQDYTELHLLDLDGKRHPLRNITIDRKILSENPIERLKKIISYDKKYMEWDKSTLKVSINNDGSLNAYFSVNYYEPKTILPPLRNL